MTRRLIISRRDVEGGALFAHSTSANDLASLPTPHTPTYPRGTEDVDRCEGDRRLGSLPETPVHPEVQEAEYGQRRPQGVARDEDLDVLVVLHVLPNRIADLWSSSSSSSSSRASGAVRRGERDSKKRADGEISRAADNMRGEGGGT